MAVVVVCGLMEIPYAHPHPLLTAPRSGGGGGGGGRVWLGIPHVNPHHPTFLRSGGDVGGGDGSCRRGV